MHEVDISALDLNLLVVLEQLLEKPSVSAAAEALQMSQPAASRALARLRQMFADPLLVPSGRGLVLTPRGESLRQPVREWMRATRSLMRPEGFDPAVAEFTLRLQTFDYGSLIFLPRLLKRLRSHAPNLEVLLPPNVDRPLEQLRQGTLDLTAGLFVSLPRDYHSAPLFRDDYLSVTRPGLVTELGLETFVKLDHAMIATGSTPGGPVDDALEKLGLCRRVRLRLPHFMAAPILVSQNDLVLTLPGRVARALAEMVPLQVWTPPVQLSGFGIDMVWHQRSHHDPAHRWIRQQAIAAAQEMCDG